MSSRRDYILNNFKVLEETVKDELETLKKLVKEKDGLLKLKPSNYTLRAGGSILHDFYTGIEKIFQDISKEVDRRVPIGESWYSELLHQMTLNIPGLRPPVITISTEKKLREYLAFRHLFRKRYGFELEWAKIKRLLVHLPKILSTLEKEIMLFFKSLPIAS